MPELLTDEEFLRYGRQILLPEIGEVGQARLKKSKVLIVGLGGGGGVLRLRSILPQPASGNSGWLMVTRSIAAICNVRCCTVPVTAIRPKPKRRHPI